MENALRNLNPQQLEAVTASDGPIMIIAGAGSGKTRVITMRIAWLIYNHVAPASILAMTFTNKAAEVMKQRVASITRAFSNGYTRIGTFHSNCSRILREEYSYCNLKRDFIIIPESDQMRLVKNILKDESLDPKKKIQPWAILEKISRAKMLLYSADDQKDAISDNIDEIAWKVRIEYDKYLSSINGVDFDDLIFDVVSLFRENPDVLQKYQERFRYLLVDEYQDTNLSQFELIKLLSSTDQNVMVVGDEDQSIYSWRGADINNILEFERHFPKAKTIRLEQNYRSTQNILSVANDIISHNNKRLGKNLFTDVRTNFPVLVMRTRREMDESTEIAETIRELVQCSACAYHDIAIFYRVNALSRTYEDALRAANVPYRVIGGMRFYDRAEIRDIIAYLQLVQNTNNNLALRRIINLPRRGIGTKGIESIAQFAEEQKISEFDVLANEIYRKQILSKKSGNEIAKFVELIMSCREMATTGSVSEILNKVINDTGYLVYLKQSAMNELEARNKEDIISELLSSVKEYEMNHQLNLEEWLERISLAQEYDNDGNDSDDKVSLMTLHAAKGLEFDYVFITALEDFVFPSPRAISSFNEDGFEEERRLFYVGITRARKHLVLSYTTSRLLYGEVHYCFPSQFISEINCDKLTPYRRSLLFDVKQTIPRNDNIIPEKTQYHGKYYVGQMVKHKLLGTGQIVEVTMGQNELLTIQFESKSKIRLISKYADLQILD